MTVPLPTLSTFGWVKSPPEKADFLLAHFCYSDKVQTSLYGKNVANLQWILEENSGNMGNTCAAIAATLTTYFTRYYTGCNVTCTSREADPVNSKSRIELVLSVLITDDGKDYQLNKMISVIDGRFQQFATLNNGAS